MNLHRIVVAIVLLIAVAACSPLIRPSVQLTPDLTGYTTSTQTLNSPDGQWTAEALVALPNRDGNVDSRTYYQQLTIARADGSQRFAPLRIWSPYGLGYDYPALTRWSNDGQSLYFTITEAVDGCGIFTSGHNLQRFDVTDNSITRILFGDQWATFAPDGERVAYFINGVPAIRDLATQAEQYADYALDTEGRSGHLIWSADGSHIAYTIANRPCVNGWTESTTLVVVDSTSMARRELLVEDERRLVAVQWLDTAHILARNPETAETFSVAIETGAVTAIGTPVTVTERADWIFRTTSEVGGLTLQRNGGLIWELLPSGAFIGASTWSPDGKTVVVEQRNVAVNPESSQLEPTNEPLQLWKIDLADPVQIRPELLFPSPASDADHLGKTAPAQAQFGAWSPDGRHLLFWNGAMGASIAADGLPAYVVDVVTADVTQIATAALLNARYYSWRPDSKQLVFTNGGYRSAQINKWLDLFDTETGSVTTLTSDTTQIPGIVAWSPDRELIAYAAVDAALTGDEFADWMTFDNQAIAGRRIYLLDPQTGESRRLNDDESYQDVPVWSKDGATLYYVARDGDELVLAAADPQTGIGTYIDSSHTPLPEMVGYYGQSDWDTILAYIP